jgi:tRNA(fMet)-specific endonuclease VapC
MSLLIDTDIIIYSIKGVSSVQNEFIKNESLPKAISVITFGELLHGAKKSKNSEQNLALIYRIAEIFPILPITRSVIETFAELKRILEKEGRIIPDLDLLIASTALTHNYTLVTNNEKHFSKINGLKLDNWYKKSGK